MIACEAKDLRARKKKRSLESRANKIKLACYDEYFRFFTRPVIIQKQTFNQLFSSRLFGFIWDIKQ